MKMLFRAALALLALSCAPAMAADPNIGKQVAAPAGYIPSGAIYCADANAKAVACAFGGGSGGGAVADVFSSGTIALGTANATFTVPVAAGQTTASFTISGLTGSAATVVAEGNSAGTGTAQWGALSAYPASTGVATSSWTSDSSFSFNVSGRTQVRLRVSVAGTGTASATANLSVAQRDVGIDKPLPAGANFLGGSGLYVWTGTAWAQLQFGQATKALSIPVTLPSDGAGAAIGLPTDTAWDLSATSSSIVAIEKAEAAKMEAMRLLLAGTLNVTGTVTLGAGSNIAGKVGIDQTTQGVSNGVAMLDGTGIAIPSAVLSNDAQSYNSRGLTVNSRSLLWDGGAAGTAGDKARSLQATDMAAGLGVTAMGTVPTSAASQGIAPDASGSITASKTLKGSAGNLFGLNVVSGTASTYLLLFDAASPPADGAVTPVKCYTIAASTSVDFNWRPVPIKFSTGIVASLSSTGCFTKTAVNGAAQGFISGDYK